MTEYNLGYYHALNWIESELDKMDSDEFVNLKYEEVIEVKRNHIAEEDISNPPYLVKAAICNEYEQKFITITGARTYVEAEHLRNVFREEHGIHGDIAFFIIDNDLTDKK